MTIPRAAVSAFLVVTASGLGAGAPAGSSDQGETREIQARVHAFLRAFENLDMPAFIACFASDATVFFPAPEPPLRFEGRAAIQQHFETVFEGVRTASKRPGPPFHTLNPEDLRIQVIGPEAAVVSFHLKNEQRVARRTLVLKKVRGAWQIAHLHASNLPVGPG